jgi:hypothetical protein
MVVVIITEIIAKEATWKANMEEEEIPTEIADKDMAEVDKVMEEVEAIQEMIKVVMQDLREALSTAEVNDASITRREDMAKDKEDMVKVREDMVKVRENMVKIKEGMVKVKVAIIKDLEEAVQIPALRMAAVAAMEEGATTSLVQCIMRTSTLAPVAMEICSTKRLACWVVRSNTCRTKTSMNSKLCRRINRCTEIKEVVHRILKTWEWRPRCKLSRRSPVVKAVVVAGRISSLVWPWLKPPSSSISNLLKEMRLREASKMLFPQLHRWH